MRKTSDSRILVYAQNLCYPYPYQIQLETLSSFVKVSAGLQRLLKLNTYMYATFN